MLRVRYYTGATHTTGPKWNDAYLVSMLADPRSADGVKVLLARVPEKDSAWDVAEGLEVFVHTRGLSSLRIARRMIPLLDLEDKT